MSQNPLRAPFTPAQRSLLLITTALALAAAVFRVLISQQLEHTALVFIGIPTLLAFMVVLSPNAKSATGTILKVITLSLLLSAVIFGEAFVCILFAAPVFYMVGIAVGTFLDRRRKNQPPTIKTILVLLVIVTPASLEGVIPGFEFERHERVTATRVVRASAREVAATLAQSPRFDRRLPLFLQLGFPSPAGAAGHGLAAGDSRSIQLLHGHHPGTLVFTIEASGLGFVDFVATSDTSYITHWLSWRRAEIRWREIAPGATEVAWTLTYRRRLDPAWYFRPLERHGVSQAAQYLIDTLATPR